MRIPSDSSQQPHAPRPGVLQVLALKSGQTVSAQVTGRAPQGQTQVQINGQQVNLALPTNVQIGEILQFQVKGGGAVPELILLSSANGQEGHRPAPQQQSQNPSQQQPQPQAQAQTTPQSNNPPTQSSTPAPVPAATSAQVPTIQVTLPEGGQRPAAPPPPAASPTGPPPTGAPPPSPGTTQAPPQAFGSLSAPSGQPAQTSVPLPQSVQTNLGLQPGQLVTAQVSPPVAGGTAQITIGTQQIPANLPGNLPIGAVLNFQVEGAGGNARLVLVGQSAPPQAPATAPPARAPGLPPATAPEVLATSSNLAPPTSVADAITKTAAIAATRQDSIGTLISSLIGLQSGKSELPVPVAAAARQLLAHPIKIGDGPPPAAQLQAAVMQSGVFLEALVAQGRSPAAQADVKAIMFLLRGALGSWLGDDAEELAPNNKRPPPPTRGATPRASLPNQPPPSDPGSLRDLARQLLAQTDSALSRVRLFQLSSLPDAAGRATPGSGPAEWNLEIPFNLSGELAMAQFQVSRDGSNESDPAARGWHMAFSINLAAIGEVGAKISQHVGRTGVMMWAENEETAQMIEQMLPELVNSLEAIGLTPGTVLVRHGAPNNPAPPSGGFVDAVS